jgi:Ni/Co efflux regulator RcnB
MTKRNIAILTSVAALSFAAAPIASAASSTHTAGSRDRVHDVRSDRAGASRSRDVKSVDRTRDTLSRDLRIDH